LNKVNKNYKNSKLITKHRSRRGSIATRVRSTIFSIFGEDNLPPINTKSSPQEIVAWKNSSQVRNVANKLNQSISDNEEMTWHARILEKSWANSKKLSEEKIGFTLSICQYLLSPKIETIKIVDETIRKILKKNIVSKNAKNFSLCEIHINILFFIYRKN
jgi:hypothetical protein